MKLKKGYVVNAIADEGIIVPVDIQNNNETSYYLNSVGLFLVKLLKKECTEDDLLESLLNTYDVSLEDASKAIHDFINQLYAWNLLEKDECEGNE